MALPNLQVQAAADCGGQPEHGAVLPGHTCGQAGAGVPAEGVDSDAAALTQSARGLESNRLHFNYTVALVEGASTVYGVS